MNEQISKAIINVMKDVKGIDKSMTVGEGKNSYKGVSDQEVKQIIGDSMAKNGLCMVPISVEAKTHIDRWEATEQWGSNAPVTKMKQSVHVEATTKYLLIHESGESIEIAGYGHGVDSQDKAAGKATTYALKYALLYTFLVPTGKIDDADNSHSDEKQTPPPKPAPKPTSQVNMTTEYTKAIMQEVDNAATQAEVAAIWQKYPALGRASQDFKTDIENKGKALQK